MSIADGMASPTLPMAAASCERTMRAIRSTSAEIRSSQVLAPSAGLLEDARERGRGHGRLLGGEREAAHLHDEERARVVAREDKALEEARQLQPQQ